MKDPNAWTLNQAGEVSRGSVRTTLALSAMAAAAASTPAVGFSNRGVFPSAVLGSIVGESSRKRRRRSKRRRADRPGLSLHMPGLGGAGSGDGKQQHTCRSRADSVPTEIAIARAAKLARRASRMP